MQEVVDEPKPIGEDLAQLIEKMRATAVVSPAKEYADTEEKNRLRGTHWSPFASKVGKRYAGCRLENFTAGDGDGRKVAVDQLYAFAESFKPDAGVGLVFLGPRGTGKDHLAVGTVRECIRVACVSADWCDGQSLFAEFRDRISNEESEGRRIRELVAPQILVISDPVPQDGKLTDYQQGILWQIIDGRYRQMRSTWITANATSEAELCSKMGAQLVDRIVGGATVVMTTGWRSFRVPGQIIKPQGDK